MMACCHDLLEHLLSSAVNRCTLLIRKTTNKMRVVRIFGFRTGVFRGCCFRAFCVRAFCVSRFFFAGVVLDDENLMKIRAGRPDISSKFPVPRWSVPVGYIHIDIKTRDFGRHILRF